MRAHNLPAFVSYTAGTYVCNSVMYNMLYLLDRRFPGIRSGFIHVPFAPQQVVGKPNGTPCMPLHDVAKALEYAGRPIRRKAMPNPAASAVHAAAGRAVGC